MLLSWVFPARWATNIEETLSARLIDIDLLFAARRAEDRVAPIDQNDVLLESSEAIGGE
jgi:hypothetical protein